MREGTLSVAANKSFIVRTNTYSHLILADEYFTFVNVSSLRHRDVYDTILQNVII